MMSPAPHNKAAKAWLAVTVLCAFVLAVFFVTPFNASGTDLYDACQVAGQELDLNFRIKHPSDGSAAFPLHNRCNALYDLVPEWVNPTVSAFAAVMALSLIGLLISRRPFTEHS